MTMQKICNTIQKGSGKDGCMYWSSYIDTANWDDYMGFEGEMNHESSSI